MALCRTRSAHTGHSLPHRFGSHERVTAPDGRVLVNTPVCSWCGTREAS